MVSIIPAAIAPYFIS